MTLRQAGVLVPALVTLVLAVAPLAGGSGPAASPQAGTADPDFVDDLRRRRQVLAEALHAGEIFVAFSAPKRVYSRDIDYEYRQDSDLYYLTGIEQPESTLVLSPGHPDGEEWLFILPRDPEQEHWDGPRLSVAEAAARSGVAAVRVTRDLDELVHEALEAGGDRLVLLATDDTSSGNGSDSRPESITTDVYASLGDTAAVSRAFVRRLRERHPRLSTRSVRATVDEMRRVKSPLEQALLRRSVAIASEAHRTGMAATRPGAVEREVEAAMIRTLLARGASGWSYPPIVASGPETTVLHESGSQRRMQAGDLLLVDAGASFGYLASDITRTYPVDGRFTTDQRTLYELVLAAQQAGIDHADRPDATLDSIHEAAARVMARGLERLGLIADADGEQYRLWFTHRSVHYLGLDVHDVGDPGAPLRPGVAFVIEPGVYIRPDALERLPASRERDAFVRQVAAAVARFGSVGVRIEDSFLVTSTGVERLSTPVPRTVDEIERAMAR